MNKLTDPAGRLHSHTSRLFDKPRNGRVAVKVINHLGDEVMKVFRVERGICTELLLLCDCIWDEQMANHG